MVLSALFLGEPISKRLCCAAMVSVCGVILVANPELQLPQNLPRIYILGICLQTLAGMLFAVQVVLVRVPNMNVHYMTTTISVWIPSALIICPRRRRPSKIQFRVAYLIVWVFIWIHRVHIRKNNVCNFYSGSTRSLLGNDIRTQWSDVLTIKQCSGCAVEHVWTTIHLIWLVVGTVLLKSLFPQYQCAVNTIQLIDDKASSIANFGLDNSIKMSCMQIWRLQSSNIRTRLHINCTTLKLRSFELEHRWSKLCIINLNYAVINMLFVGGEVLNSKE